MHDSRRVLVVTPYLPSPPKFGGQQRMHALIAGLAQREHVTLLSLVDPREDVVEGVRACREYCREVVTVPSARGEHKRGWQLAASASPWSYERLTTSVPALQRELDHMLARERWDLVHLEFVHTAGVRVRVPEGAAPAICLDEHNVEYEILFRTARTATGVFRRAYDVLDGVKMRAEEHRAWERVDGCALTSARDEAMLHAWAPEKRTVVVPNGVDVDYFRPAGRAAREPATLLFFGAMNYYPNTDGALWFLAEIWPRIAAMRPHARLRIVGRAPPPEVLAHAGPNVEIPGALDDLRPSIEAATAMIVPLRIGGGTRLKILEAMAMEKAIVSTTLGAEGLDVVPERDILIGDGPERFAAQVVRLLDDPALAARVGEAARRVVGAGYTWRTSVERLASFHDELVAARRVA